MEFYKRRISPKEGDHEFGERTWNFKRTTKTANIPRNPKRGAQEAKKPDGIQQNHVKPQKIKVTITKFGSKYLSTWVTIELIDELTTSNSPLDDVKWKFKPKNQHWSKDTGWNPPELCQNPIHNNRWRTQISKPKIFSYVLRNALIDEFTTPMPPTNVVYWKFKQTTSTAKQRNRVEFYNTMPKAQEQKVVNPKFEFKALPARVSTENCTRWRARHSNSSHNCFKLKIQTKTSTSNSTSHNGWNSTTPCRKPRKNGDEPKLRYQEFFPPVWAPRIALTIDELTTSNFTKDVMNCTSPQHHQNISINNRLFSIQWG